FIQTTASLGFFVSLAVILLVRLNLSEEAFESWGWRLPFLFSIFLVAISIYIRLRMKESPLFAKLKASGQVSRNPIRESFGKKENLKFVLIALFGATAGQGVVWYTGQFYALSFIQKTCSIEFVQSYYILAVALLLGTPLFIYFGWLSDKIGRKAIMMAGLLFAVILYRPIYQRMYDLADTSAKTVLSETNGQEENGAQVRTLMYADGSAMKATMVAESVTREITLGTSGFWSMVLLIFIQIVLVTMVYGPIAAFLVELFPTRIRYTSMSLPYHIGNDMEVYRMRVGNNSTRKAAMGPYTMVTRTNWRKSKSTIDQKPDEPSVISRVTNSRANVDHIAL